VIGDRAYDAARRAARTTRQRPKVATANRTRTLCEARTSTVSSPLRPRRKTLRPTSRRPCFREVCRPRPWARCLRMVEDRPSGIGHLPPIAPRFRGRAGLLASRPSRRCKAGWGWPRRPLCRVSWPHGRAQPLPVRKLQAVRILREAGRAWALLAHKRSTHQAHP
jgi:hypothetical protein